MEGQIYFGRIGSYNDKEGNTNYTIDYMSDTGVTHRDKISQKMYNHLKTLELNPCQVVNAIFEVDIFNKITLVDITL